ncbi:MAG: PAS domain S-box protein [Chlamydiales bacterium]|nr:PAS domain S-box protein [Chlamydiales bacterium]
MDDVPQKNDLLTVLNYAIDGIVTFDSSGKIEFFNAAAQEIFGYECHEVVGQSISLLFPHVKEQNYKDIEEVFEADVTRITAREVVARHKKGYPFSLELRIGKINTPERVIMWGMFRDLTTEKNQEKMLHDMNIILDSVTIAQSQFIKDKSAENVKRIFQQFLFDILAVTQSSVGIIVRYDETSNEVLPLALSDDEWQKYFTRCSLDDFKNTDPYLHFLINKIPEVIKNRKITIGNMKCGVCKLKNYLAMPMIKKNRIVGLIAIANNSHAYSSEINYLLLPVLQACVILMEAHDNEQKRQKMEMQIADSLKKLELQNVELEGARDAAMRANLAKSAFLANMSHEIRTPLNGVMGMTELLLNTELNQKQQRYANNIYMSSEMLLHIVNDVLDLSKIEAGELRLESISFNLLDLIKDLISMLDVKAREKKIEIAVYYSPSIPMTFIGDPVRIRQILINLIGNAVKFTDQGSVTLSVTLQQDGKLYFQIVDTGIGISEEVQKKLFGSFVQADVSTTRKYGGTGLGLAICKKLVHKMKGKIGVESAEGKGSTFWFTLDLPVAEKQQILPMNIDKCAVIVGKQTENKKIFERYLHDMGVVSTHCHTLEEAINKVKDKHCGAVFCDQASALDDEKKLYSLLDDDSAAVVVGLDDGDQQQNKSKENNLVHYLAFPLYPDQIRGVLCQENHAED